ncbi:uncharacterized protein N7477_000770 [Penicillium maclennaniae]|uniref:uncharacterized protein n=1 Tax=Penicillium maclennaniae TaxID=1343394 RepID=UPI00253FC457|nr:uncharacterized protein N7477_000770 [Penicillium maclennaniae]KAJ5684425.1 hypothetical protein N7477_000770 [Penicillium maclennaniae]
MKSATTLSVALAAVGPDPCGPMYDPVQGVYHLHYQFHPNHVAWGNVSWGHATSVDLVTWTDVDHHPDNDIPAWKDQEMQSFGTTNLTSRHNPPLYNHLSIFSGSAQPVNLSGGIDGTILAFYTAASELPTAWNEPYLPGTESQALAYSTDGGVTWSHYENNPILSDPPGNWNVTGWRDPYFVPWPQMDSVLNMTVPHYYAVFGSGALWEPEMNTTLGSLEETGSYGFNFELSNFFSIGDRYFVSMGAEGGNVSFHQQKWSLWNEGTISVRANGSIAFNPVSGGASDWGLLYAITTFNDTKNNRRIQWGWAQEDMNDFGITQQGYQGAFALPREIFIKDTPGIIPQFHDARPGNSRFIENVDGTWNASTLGVRPAPEVVEGLHRGAQYTKYPCDERRSNTKQFGLTRNLTKSYQIFMNIKRTTGVTGVTIGASPNREEYTNIYFDPSSNSVSVNRTHSSLIDMFANNTHVGYFEPYQFANGSTESIEMDIFVDGSLVEVYLNERFALTSRIYPSREDSVEVSLFSAPGVEVEYSKIEVWDGLLKAWPDRLVNTSSLLVFDTPAETGNYTWWTGN